MVKNLPDNTRDTGAVGSVPGLGRSPGGGHGNPLQYSCLVNPMDRGAWQATVHGVVRSWTQLKRLSMHTCSKANQKNPTSQKGSPLAEKGEFIDTNNSWDSVHTKYVWIPEHISVLDLSLYRCEMCTCVLCRCEHVCTLICVTTRFSNLLSFVLAPF